MYFRDETTIDVTAGRGGDGRIAFHREKFKPKGGPSGGDGGDGGSIIFIADENLNTLYELHRRHKIYAPSGEPGGSNKRSGRKGKDVTIRVPVGTIIRDATHDTLIRDLQIEGEQVIVATGGKGGRGNQHFATSTEQTPRVAEDGEPGEARKLNLELRLIADVGLVGLPNAGKSTFLSRVSQATPKIADYPFTTLVPQLGIASLDLTRTLVVADLPGLIEGASEGHGLGDTFLRHIERTRLILHVVDCSAGDTDELLHAIRLIDHELKAFSDSLANRAQILVGNKLDAGEEAEIFFREACEQLAADTSPGAPRFVASFGISGATGKGIPELMEAAWQHVMDIRRREIEARGIEPVERESVGAQSVSVDEHGVARQKIRLRGMQKVPPHKRFPDQMFEHNEFDTDAGRTDGSPSDDDEDSGGPGSD